MSSDGFTPLYCAIKETKAPVTWANVDSTESFDDIAWKVANLGGIVHRQDCKKMQAALMKATDNVGQAFVEMHKLKGESGRESYLELKSYYYGNQSVEDQKTTILTDIAKIKFQHLGRVTGIAHSVGQANNIADMLTKILSGIKKEGQAGKWMYGR